MKITRKLYLAVAIAASSLPLIANANPIPETSIPDNVDWFAHLDADQFRATQVGGLLFEELTNLDPLKNNEQLPINPILILNGLRGVTAFGTIPEPEAAQNGNVDVVVMITGTPELVQIFRGLISGFQMEKPDSIVEIQEGDQTIISMKEAGVSGVFLGEDQFAISKSLESLTRFLAVNAGKGAHLKFGEQFPVPSYEEGLGVYLGVYVDGIGNFEQLPAQARILQLTKAVAVQLGESQDNLHLLASLVTDVKETAMQVRDVLNGLVAVMTLTQNGHPDVATLVESAKVSQVDNAVTLKIDYPAASAEKWIGVLVEHIQAEMTKKAEGNDAEPVEPISEVEPIG